jgi:hypothetical protein
VESVTSVRQLPALDTIATVHGANVRFADLSCEHDYEVVVRAAKASGESGGARKLPVSGAELRGASGKLAHEVVLELR